MTSSTFCFAKEATALIRLGFHPVPIKPRDKFPAQYLAGTWYGLRNWHKFRDRKLNVSECEYISNWPDVNIGMVLGTKVGDHHVIAIDIDAQSSAEVEELISALPSSPMAKVGAKGVTLFFRGDFAFKTTNYARQSGQAREMLCEILTGNKTRQTVIPPSVHPKGMTYRWVRGPVHAHLLPILSIDHIKVLEETLERLGCDPIGPKGAIAKPNTWEQSSARKDTCSPFAELNFEALQDLDAWVPKLGLYKLQPKVGGNGYKAVATWRASSTNRPVDHRNRNLHFTPKGIRDFGADTGYSPIDITIKAFGFSIDDAYLWLANQIYGESKATNGALLKPSGESLKR